MTCQEVLCNKTARRSFGGLLVILIAAAFAYQFKDQATLYARDFTSTSTIHQRRQYINDDTRATRVTDVLFTVKTCRLFHKTRLKVLLDTWISLVSDQTYVVTDGDGDDEFRKLLPLGHLINTSCRASHARRDLCCKMGYELNVMLNHSQSYRWFCRVDDDTYVGTRGLMTMLAKYDWRTPTIIGRPAFQKNALEDGNKFGFPNGNAGVCMSRAHIQRIQPYIVGKEFTKFCNPRSLTDDVCLGVVSYVHGGVRVQKCDMMYKHGSSWGRIRARPFATLVTVNYRQKAGVIVKVAIDPLSPSFNLTTDPTRLRSLHCHLNPTLRYCAPLFPGNHTNTG